MIVLNSLVEGHQHRYYAIVCKGFPHTLRVAEDSALSAENSGANNGAQNTQQKPLCISFCFSLDGQILHCLTLKRSKPTCVKSRIIVNQFIGLTPLPPRPPPQQQGWVTYRPQISCFKQQRWMLVLFADNYN